MEDSSLKWSAPEYHHYERSTDWFWAVGIITACIAILAFFFHNALFGVLILLSAGILISYTLRVPENVDYEINQRGVVIGKDLHPYITIESFWVETRFGEPKIILKSKKNMLPYLLIPIHEDDIDQMAAILRNFLEEKELQEPASHKFMEYLGF
jgi:hypothetical protein